PCVWTHRYCDKLSLPPYLIDILANAWVSAVDSSPDYRVQYSFLHVVSIHLTTTSTVCNGLSACNVDSSHEFYYV
ncbi:MAG: hypothetical protein AAF587_44395, partial [Bacteroidota bacterium]